MPIVTSSMSAQAFWDEMREATRKKKRRAPELVVGPAVADFASFVSVAKFMRRIETHYDKAENTYSARETSNGHQFLSLYGEGIRVTYGEGVQGRPLIEFIRAKDYRFSNATEFDYEVYKCMLEIEREPNEGTAKS